jgi:hypothetical protein
MDETDLRLADGRTLHVYDTAPGDDGRLALITDKWDQEMKI